MAVVPGSQDCVAVAFVAIRIGCQNITTSARCISKEAKPRTLHEGVWLSGVLQKIVSPHPCPLTSCPWGSCNVVDLLCMYSATGTSTLSLIGHSEAASSIVTSQQEVQRVRKVCMYFACSPAVSSVRVLCLPLIVQKHDCEILETGWKCCLSLFVALRWTGDLSTA